MKTQKFSFFKITQKVETVSRKRDFIRNSKAQLFYNMSHPVYFTVFDVPMLYMGLYEVSRV